MKYRYSVATEIYELRRTLMGFADSAPVWYVKWPTLLLLCDRVKKRVGNVTYVVLVGLFW